MYFIPFFKQKAIFKKSFVFGVLQPTFSKVGQWQVHMYSSVHQWLQQDGRGVKNKGKTYLQEV